MRNDPNTKKSQVSVGMTDEEKKALSKQSFKQNRSISQIMRFAIKKYLDSLSTPAMQPIHAESVEELFTKLGAQLALNADILNALQLVLIEMSSKGVGYPLQFKHFSDNATTFTGFDKFDLLNNEFFHSRIHPDDLSDNLILVPDDMSWECNFRFKKAPGEYFNSRMFLRHITDRRIVASWQFLGEA